MRISLLFFLILSLCPFNVLGKKLYKYKDPQGILHFTDQPSASESALYVRQLKPAPQQMVRLSQSGPEQQPQFYIRNDYAGPVEVEIVLGEGDNVRTEPTLPKRFVIEPGKSDAILVASGVDQDKAWRLAVKYRYVIGRPMVGYNPTISYLPPIAPNATFEISQAFGGNFSHTDIQNKYAVDIVMPVGTPVYAARSGIVLEAEDDYFKGGDNKAYSTEANSIRILHDDGAMSIYAHLELEKTQVYPGLTVSAGQLIGYSGNTGYTTGPHLHFAVQINQGMELVSVPFTFINQQGQAEVPLVNTKLTGVVVP